MLFFPKPAHFNDFYVAKQMSKDPGLNSMLTKYVFAAFWF